MRCGKVLRQTDIPKTDQSGRIAHNKLRHKGEGMPEEEIVQRAREDAREGKSPSTQAGEFVREEMHHIREGKHGARSTQQAIAIGLSKARRSGVKLGPPKGGTASPKVRAQAERDTRKGQASSQPKPSRKRSRHSNALRREPHSPAFRASLAGHARSVAKKRGGRARHESAMRAAQTRSNRRSGGRRPAGRHRA